MLEIDGTHHDGVFVPDRPVDLPDGAKARIHVPERAADEPLVVMREEDWPTTPEGIAAAEEIAAVEGVDALQIGSNDLTTAMGIPGQFKHERLRDAFRTTIAACRKVGKPMIPGGIRDAATIVDYIKMGAARCYFGPLFQTLGVRQRNLAGHKME